MGIEPDHTALVGQSSIGIAIFSEETGPAATALATAKAIRRFASKVKSTTYLAFKIVDTVYFDIIYNMSTS